LLVFPSCTPRQEKVEWIIEDGVEVIVNHLAPYQIKCESNTFTFGEEFVIDSESENFAELGNVKNTYQSPSNLLIYKEIGNNRGS
jgi:hypothetical protein